MLYLVKFCGFIDNCESVIDQFQTVQETLHRLILVIAIMTTEYQSIQFVNLLIAVLLLQGDDTFNEPEFDRIFTNTMKSFTNGDNLYNQYFIYVGKPDGTFRGSRVLLTNETELLVSVRDATNNYTRQTFYTDTQNIARNNSVFDTNNIYDPRCRPWYVYAIKKRFSGTLREACPGDTFSVDDLTSLSRQTQACKDAITQYKQLFNISNQNITSEIDSIAINQGANDTSQYLVWSTYVFTSLNAIGITSTASAAIKERNSNDLLGIGIDYTLDGLSKILNESIGSAIEYENWHSWIFSANKQDLYNDNRISINTGIDKRSKNLIFKSTKIVMIYFTPK